MARIGQIYYRIPSGSGYDSNISADNLYGTTGNLLTAITPSVNQLTKVGIQAPPGTQMVLNQIKYIMVGRTGIYELDEDIAITELYFVKPKKYTVNVGATESNKIQGANKMQQAKETYEQDLNALGSPNTEADYERLHQIIAKYEYDYSEGYALYTTKEYDVEDGDLENVIIDFVCE